MGRFGKEFKITVPWANKSFHNQIPTTVNGKQITTVSALDLYLYVHIMKHYMQTILLQLDCETQSTFNVETMHSCFLGFVQGLGLCFALLNSCNRQHLQRKPPQVNGWASLCHSHPTRGRGRQITHQRLLGTLENLLLRSITERRFL